MNPETRYAAVGIFLLLGIGTLVLLIMWFDDRGQSESVSHYVVRIDSEVNGLSNGSAVRFLGVDVGSVASIQLNTRPTPHVDVLIEIADSAPVDDTTYATLAAQGITGIANIDLDSDRDDPSPARHTADGMRIIPYRATGLSAVLANSGSLTDAAQQFLARLNAWSSAGNLERLTAILQNLEQVTGALSEQREQIPEIVGALTDASKRLNRTAGLLEDEVRDDLPAIAGDLRTASQSLASLSTTANALLDDNATNIDRLLGEGTASMSEILRELRDAASNLADLSNKLENDPSRLVYRGQHDPVVAEP